MTKTLFIITLFFFQNAFSQNTAWTLVQAGEDIYNGQLDLSEWPNRWDIESLDMKPVQDGFLTCGYYNDQTFDSTDGNTYDLTDKYGAYLAKYNYSGVLQWIVRTEKAPMEERNVIMSIATDSQNNIYIIGHSDGTLYDTTGQALAVAPQWPSGGSSSFLMKFNQNGVFKWKTLIAGADPKRVAVDNNDNVVVCGNYWGQNSGHMFFNNQYVGIFTDITNEDVNYYIAKYAPDGMPLWDAGVHIDSVNDQFLEGITFDANNNIYLNGMYEMNLKVYDADESDFIERTWSGNYGGTMFFAKYTSAGDAQWVVNSNDCKLSEIITNPDGSHYIAGTNTVQNGTGSHSMTNADGTNTTQSMYGPYFFAKIDADGNWEWVTGSTGTTQGKAYEMTKHDNKISIVGHLGNWGESSITGMIYGTENSTAITIDVADIFISTYDLDGKLLRVTKSGNNGDDFAPQNTSGFFKGEDGSFYIQRNLWFYLDSEAQNFYGQAIAPLIGTDASITKFNELDGVVILSADKPVAAAYGLAPNPTDKNITIALGNIFEQADVLITDISGKIVVRQTYNNVNKISADINGDAGIYLVKVDTGNSVQWYKVVKK